MRALAAILVGLALLAPTSAAWIAPPAPQLASNTFLANWILDWGHFAGKAIGKGKTKTAAACIVGDANHDGHYDLLVRIKSKSTGQSLLKLLLGPDFHRTLWVKERKLAARLTCVGDSQGDGLNDPLVQTNTSAPSTIPAVPDTIPLDNDEQLDTTESLDGATGEPLATTQDATSATSATPSSPIIAQRTTDAQLAPVAPGVLLHLENETTTTGTPATLKGTPLTTTSENSTLTIDNARGQPEATIQPSSPRDEILGAGATPAANGVTNILVLSAQDASPIDQAPAQTPALTAYTPNGNVAWHAQLPQTTGTPVLVPNAGDVNGDNVTDSIVEIVPPAVNPTNAGASVTIVSGKDGSTLQQTAPASGTTAALPFGDTTPTHEIQQAATPPQGDAILLIHQATPTSGLDVTCQQGGKTIWNVQLPPKAVPVDPITDPYTGDITGFQDLTGDGAPDLAVLEPTSSGSQIRAIDGTNGTTMWTTPVGPDSSATAVPRAGNASDILVTTNATQGNTFTLTRLDGRTGAPTWTSTGTIPSTGTHDVNVDPVTSPGKNSTPDLVVTVDPTTNDTGGGGVFVVNGGNGTSPWTGPTGVDQPPPPPLESTSAAPPAAPPGSAFPWWLILLAGCVACGVVLVVVVKRRKRDD